MINYQPAPEAVLKRVQALIAAKPGGKSQVARILGCSRLTVKACAAGLPIHPFTAQRMAEVIAARDAAGKNP
jgi:hypothetical protein